MANSTHEKSKALYEKVLLLRGKGFSGKDTASLIGCSDKMAYYVFAISESIKSKSWSDVERKAKACNVNLDALFDALGADKSEYVDYLTALKDPVAAEPESPEPKPAPAKPAVDSATVQFDPLYLVKLLQGLHDLNELISGVASADLPIYTQKIVDAVTASTPTFESDSTAVIKVIQDGFKSLQSVICESFRINMDRNTGIIENQLKDMNNTLRSISNMINRNEKNWGRR